MTIARDLQLARRAAKHGARYSLRIIWEARRANIAISLAFALVEKESNFANIFGHDTTASIPPNWKGGEVTKERFRHYRANRSAHGCQGVGPCQITWYSYQDRADLLGGCWKPKHSIRVAFEEMARLIKNAALRDKCDLPAVYGQYNGSGEAARAYGADLLARQYRWHKWLVG